MRLSIIRMLLLMIARAFSFLRFSPNKTLEFLNSAALIPSMKEITIMNNYDREVSLFSISFDSSNFHSETFQSIVLRQLDSVDIEIIFLSYYPKTVRSILTINTSEGQVLYSIIGKPDPNPYKLRPFLGQRLDVGSKPHEQPIIIYNPYPETLIIEEIFTTESFLSLKSIRTDESEQYGSATNISIAIQPNGSSAVLGAPSISWSINPGFEKEIIVFTMAPIATGRFFGYVHVRTSYHNIVFPVELQVKSFKNYVPFECNISYGISCDIFPNLS